MRQYVCVCLSVCVSAPEDINNQWHDILHGSTSVASTALTKSSLASVHDILKKRKCRKTALSGYYAFCSHDLLFKPSGVPTLVDEMISRNQVRGPVARARLV